MFLCVCTCKCVCMCIVVCLCVCSRVYMFVWCVCIQCSCMCAGMCVWVCIVCLYVCRCVCVQCACMCAGVCVCVVCVVRHRVLLAGTGCLSPFLFPIALINLCNSSWNGLAAPCLPCLGPPRFQWDFTLRILWAVLVSQVMFWLCLSKVLGVTQGNLLRKFILDPRGKRIHSGVCS